MTRLSFARVVFMEQTYYCAKVVLCSIYTFILFPYSSCMSPASAFGHAGTSASNRQAQKLERIWGDTDHQGNKATTGNACVKTRVERRDSPPCFTKASLCLFEKLHSWCPCCSRVWAASRFLLACWICLVLPSTAVLPACSPPSLVLLSPYPCSSLAKLLSFLFFCCSHAPCNLDIAWFSCLAFVASL